MAKKCDPKKVATWYVIDLRQPHSYWGELSYSYDRIMARGGHEPELNSYVSLTISGVLSYTTNKSIQPGLKVKVRLLVAGTFAASRVSGEVEQRNGELLFHLWLPEWIINHVHLTLMSSSPEALQIFGTELLRRRGDLHGIYLLKHYDEENLPGA